jgi:hypothetical protein
MREDVTGAVVIDSNGSRSSAALDYRDGAGSAAQRRKRLVDRGEILGVLLGRARQLADLLGTSPE